MGFGVLAGGFAACENPKIPIPPPWGGGQGVGKNRGFDLVKALGGLWKIIDKHMERAYSSRGVKQTTRINEVTP